MDYVWVVISIIVVISCLYFIGSPFLDTAIARSPIELNDKQWLKDRLYQSLNELEIDYLMKKLSKEDYQEIQRSLKQSLMQEMKAREQFMPDQKMLSDTHEFDEELRKQLDNLRKNR